MSLGRLTPSRALARVRVAEVLAPVATPNRTSAMHVLDDEGRRWVRKRANQRRPRGVFAEALAWLIGREIAAPLPDGAVTNDGEWLSLTLPGAVPLSREFAARVADVPSIARLLVLDVLCGNIDRHPGNVLLEPLHDGTQWRLWGIDFDRSALEAPNSLVGHELAIPRPPALACWWPRELLSSGLTDACTRARSIRPELWTEVIDSASKAAQRASSSELAVILAHRSERLPDMMDAYFQRAEVQP